MDIKERMANVGMTQVDMILELQKRGYAVQPPMMSSILRGVYTYPKARIEESAIKVSTVKAPHTYMKAVGTRELEKILEEELGNEDTK